MLQNNFPNSLCTYVLPKITKPVLVSKLPKWINCKDNEKLKEEKQRTKNTIETEEEITNNKCLHFGKG